MKDRIRSLSKMFSLTEKELYNDLCHINAPRGIAIKSKRTFIGHMGIIDESYVLTEDEYDEVIIIDQILEYTNRKLNKNFYIKKVKYLFDDFISIEGGIDDKPFSISTVIKRINEAAF